jgi:ribosomal 50S subunit-recycling heat shock protein
MKAWYFFLLVRRALLSAGSVPGHFPLKKAELARRRDTCPLMDGAVCPAMLPGHRTAGPGDVPDNGRDGGKVLAELASVRVDRWLTAARIYKSRTAAQEACTAGHVTVNGVVARSSHGVVVGDEVTARAPRGDLIWAARFTGAEADRAGGSFSMNPSFTWVETSSFLRPRSRSRRYNHSCRVHRPGLRRGSPAFSVWP